MEKLELIKEINRLKNEKNAIILAHYYQDPEIQDLADFLGDSLELSRKAAQTDANIIVFAGVHFMGETAKLLAPDKKVLMPDLEAGCPMADRASYDDVKQYKENNPSRKIVCYVNSSAAVKALSDVCVTSSSAVKIVSEMAKAGEKIMYIPDKNLGMYLKNKLPNADIELWPGFCCIHEAIKEKQMKGIVEKHPNIPVIMHPECNPEAIPYADYIGSTAELLKWVQNNKPNKVIVATEKGIIHQMKKVNPDCEYILADEVLNCRQMKKNTLEKIYNVLVNEDNEIIIDDMHKSNALKPIDLMMELTK